MRAALTALLLVALAVSPGRGQDAGGRKPGAVALRNGTVVLEPGRTLEKATLVLRGGLVEAVGVGLAAPPDAEIIDATGMYVYPGFIDGLTAAGLGDTQRAPEERKKAEATPADFVADSLGGMESANRKGIRPELQAYAIVGFNDEETKKHHRGGFAAAHVAPAGEYLSGAGAIVVFNGGTRREILARARTGLAGSFRATGDGYPSTPMGVMAHLRQVFVDARRLRELKEGFEKDPAGRTRPPADPSLESLWPLLDREIPFFMEANTELEIGRALSLASEFKLDLVVTGGREAGLAADRLKAGGARVILGLRFPREPKRPKKSDATPPKEGEYEELPKPRKQFEDEKREWERRVRSAITLHEAGVPFAFSTTGLEEPAAALKQISKLVARGLPRDAALKALTTGSAGILKMDATLGAIAPGRPAAVTVLTAPLGSPETRVRFVFADGRKFDLDPAGAADATPEIDLNGVWTMTIEKSDAGPITIKAALTQKDRDLSGKLSSTSFGEGTVTFGRVVGKSFSFSAKITIDGDAAELEVKGDSKDGVLEGKLTGPFGEGVAWKGRKDP